MQTCPQCQTDNRDEVAFCISCGKKLPPSLKRFLKANGLHAHHQTLVQNHIDSLAEFAALSDDDITELGIPAGDRIRLRKALSQAELAPPIDADVSGQRVGFADVGSQAAQLFNTLGQAVGEALPVKNGQEKNWAIGMRLSGLAGFLFPGANVIAPLALWLWKRKESGLLDSTGKEVLNFQISYLSYMVVGAVIDGILKTDDVAIGIVGLAWLVLTAVGAYQAYQGRNYRYPFIFRPVK
jgi:uncharacterized Tic20 family protein